MPKHRGAIPEKGYSPKQIMFEMMLIDENGYLSPDEIFPTGGGDMARKVIKKAVASKAGKKTAKKSK